MTEISDRTLRAGGPALLFERPGRPSHSGADQPVRDARSGWRSAMGAADVGALREVGELLASLKEPEAPRGLRDALGKVALLKSALWDMAPREVRSAPCQEIVLEGPGRRPGPAADPDLLARRRRSADHLGTGRHARSATSRAKTWASTGSR